MMTISWVIFLVLTAAFSYRGYRQGVWGASTRILSLLLAYTIALLFAERLVPILENNTVIQGLAAYVSAGLFLFFTASVVLSLVFTAIGKLFKRDKPSSISARFGALIGLGIGSVVGLAVVFMLSYLTELLPKEKLPFQAQAPNGIERLSRGAAGQLMGWIGKASGLEPTTTKMSSALMREPGKVVSHLKNLQQNSDAKDLFTKPTNQQTLMSGDVTAIQELPAFQNLVNSADMQELIAVAGLDDTQSGEAALAVQMSTVWRQAQSIQDDKRVQEIVNDPEFKQQLESGDPMAMLNNANFMELASRLLNSEAAELTESHVDSVIPVKETEIYQWTDEDGNVHYGDQPIK